jgi:hypothetical protein
MRGPSTFFEDVFVGTTLLTLLGLFGWLFGSLLSGSVIGGWSTFWDVVGVSCVTSIIISMFIETGRTGD